MIKYILAFLLLTGTAASAQVIPGIPDTIKTIHLDSAITITSTRISAETFIKIMLEDNSFYEAFRNMKKFSFTADNRIFTYDKNYKVNGKIYRRIYHNNEGAYKQQVLAKSDSGQVYKKNGKYQLMTVDMFDYIFMNAYNSDFVPAEESSGSTKGKNESYKDKLKTLIFNPGRPIRGVPFISGKTEIFTANMRQYYNYEYFKGTYLDSIPVYRLKITIKPGLSNWTKDGLMIKEMTTIFDQRDLQILGRYIDMKTDNLAFDFDVKMNIELGYFGADRTLLPTKISYSGNWDHALKSRERASFLIRHTGYK